MYVYVKEIQLKCIQRLKNKFPVTKNVGYFFSLLILCSVLGGLFGNTQNKGFGFSSGLGTAAPAGATGFGTGLGTTTMGGFGGFNIQPTQQQTGKTWISRTAVVNTENSSLYLKLLLS